MMKIVDNEDNKGVDICRLFPGRLCRLFPGRLCRLFPGVLSKCSRKIIHAITVSKPREDANMSSRLDRRQDWTILEGI